MTAREAQIARLFIAACVGQRDAHIFGHCNYCGFPTVGAACRAHRDLLDLDPYYTLPVDDRIAA